MGTPLAGILTNTVSHDEDDAAAATAERIDYATKDKRPDIATPQHEQPTTDNDSIPSVPSVPSPYSPPSQSLMSATEEWMMRRRSRTAATNTKHHRKNHSNHHNNNIDTNNKPPALIHTTSSSWHDDEEDEVEDPNFALQQTQNLTQTKAECQALSKENYDLKHQLQKQTHTLLQRSRDHEERQKALQQKWQSALLQLDKAKAMNHELKTNFQKQLQQAQAQAEDWQEQCQKLQEQQPRRGKFVKEPMDAACQTDVIPTILPKQDSVACQTEHPGDACKSISCQTDAGVEPVLSTTDKGTQTDPTQFASTLEERLARIRDAAERAALVQEQQAALQQMQATHEAELERMEKQHEAALAQIIQQARQHVQEQVAEHQHKTEQQHATKLAALEAQHQAEIFRVRQEYEKSANVAEEVMRAAVAEANTTAQQLQREMEARAALEKQLKQYQMKQSDQSHERHLLLSIQEECNAIFNRKRGVVSSAPAVVSPPKSSGTTWAEADQTLGDLEALVASLTNK